MYGLVNRAIQCFLRDSFGPQIWMQVRRAAGVEAEGFEPMLIYPAQMTEALVAAAVTVLARPREAVLEDMGTYLVSHPNLERLRRLLRFGGAGFADFLHSLEDLPGRARLALPDLVLPTLVLTDLGDYRFRLECGAMFPGAGHVLTGLLRAMADDYGALVLMEHAGPGASPGSEVVMIALLDQSFAAGRRFELAGG